MSITTTNAARQDYTKRIKDTVGRLKVSVHQNVYEADFEYGKQPLRWEEYTANGGSISHMGGVGACAMYLPANTPNAITVRQSRPYHRYQPGKSMFMATAINFGTPISGQFQRVGFFDDNNGIFFEQGAPNSGNQYGMQVVVRSDANYYPNATASGTSGAPSVIQEFRVDFANWSDPQGVKNQLDWTKIQMLWCEYAWYGAGALRWGVLINGEQYILHEIGSGNNTTSQIGQITPNGGTLTNGVTAWSRTGNLPVRYEQRDNGTVTTTITTTSGSATAVIGSGTTVGVGMTITAAGVPSGTTISAISGTSVTMSQSATANGTNTPATIGYPATTMYHYGVSVIIEGRRDDQRGFTYSYGMNPSVPRRYISPNTTRYPVLSVQARALGTQEFSIIGGPATEQNILVSSTTTSASFSSSLTTTINTTLNSSSATIASTTGVQIGQQVQATGVPFGTTINAISGSTITLSANATLTQTGASVVIAPVFNLPPVASFTGNGTTATIVFTKAHNVSAGGASIVITGATSTSAINGNYTASFLSASSLTITTSITTLNASDILKLVITSPISFGANQWAGRFLYYLGADNNYYTAKISANSNNSLTFGDPIQNLPMPYAPLQGILALGTFTTGNTYVDVPNGTLFTAGQIINSVAFPLSTKITSISSNRLYVNNAATSTGSFPVVANSFFAIGQINRGQLLPETLLVSSDSLCVVELIASAPQNPVLLSNSDFQPLYNYGSYNSFATRDVTATAILNNSQGLSSGEVVYAFTTPAGGAGLQQIDLTNFFPLYNTIVGNNPDILTVAITTKATQSAGIPINSVSVSGTTATISFVSQHGLNVGDQIITTGFTPSGLNGTFSITATPDAYKAQITVTNGTTSATTLGTSTFSNGANVGAHIICQEAMS
jgi:hypothetical protein